ncbi:MAG: polyribonucleotide nucleotidyltransferase [Eubacteriaceae bacterium]|nr:polyribonucleotide nucleotidyltransferase [Eubacteriaceae bacterium]
MKQVFKTDLAGRELVVETGELAQLCNGSIFISYGDTSVLVTAAMTKTAKEGMDFFPLTVNYEEKLYAAGKIPGGFLKREGRASDNATLNARLIDRAIRPLFDKGFRNDVQVVCTIMSVEYDNLPQIAGLIGSSLALCTSDIPFDGPVAGVNVGMIGDEFILMPNSEQRETGKLNLTVAGTKDAVLMLEAGADEIDEETMVKAIFFAHEAIKKIIAFEEEIIAVVNKPKREVTYYRPSEELTEAMKEEAVALFEEALHEKEKMARNEKIENAKEALYDKYSQLFPDNAKDINEIAEKILRGQVRAQIDAEGIRPDGRTPEEIRPITCEVGKLKRVHGNGLFTRGQTQVLSSLTLGTLKEDQLLDGLTEETNKRFIHHYNFPPFCTGETGAFRSAGRREIGHGALGERALQPVIPTTEDFPYTIRIVSEVLSSNGSSSQASICASTLALMDAGVPIKAPVAGIAMGLVKTDEKVTVLADIMGMEDFYGDMDFKVAGTAEGITAIQMDIKIHGINEEILKEALAKAKIGRLYILDKMLACIDKPRTELSEYAPRIITMSVPVDKIREVIGSGGKVINGIIAETGVSIDIEDDGTVYIASTDAEGSRRAVEIIENIIRDIEVGMVFKGKVTRILPIGAFVTMPNGKEGLVHISKLANERVEKVEDVVNIGDEIEVKVVELDKQGRINLSRKALLPGATEDDNKPRSSYSANRSSNNTGRNGGGNNNRNSGNKGGGNKGNA